MKMSKNPFVKKKRKKNYPSTKIIERIINLIYQIVVMITFLSGNGK